MRRDTRLLAAGLLGLIVFDARRCHAESWGENGLVEVRPPPISSHYVQYGVAVTGETIQSAGHVCPRDGELPCILGHGGGLALRAGYQSRGPWYVGGAYEFSRQDSANLLRLAILQQFRAEARYHLLRTRRLSPYFTASLGMLAYGNEWGLDTWGGSASQGAGLQFQVTPTIVVNFALGYRQLALRRWVDGAGQERARGALGFGLAHVVALEFGFEIREPLTRW